jgi:hypothetical protein
MADFDLAFDFAMTHEDRGLTGVIATDNNGARVRYGLNEADNPLGDGYYTTMPNAQAVLVAKNQYNNKYWHSIYGDDITDQAVASKIFDMAVNEGTVEAVKLAQRAAEIPAANVDGKMGPYTLTHINAQDPGVMMTNLVTWWKWFIDKEIENKPADAVYRNNWTSRADDLPPEGAPA